MTLEEILKGQGLTEEQVKAVLDSMSENNIYTAAESGLDQKYADLKKQLEEGAPEDGKKDEEIKRLANELASEKKAAKIREELLKAHATDIDYLMYKLGENDLKLSDDGKSITGLEKVIQDAKTQYPSFFKSDAPASAEKKVEVKAWNKSEIDTPVEPATLKDAIMMKYKSEE